MIVTCENCQSRIRIMDPDPGAPTITIRCTVCQHTFAVNKAMIPPEAGTLPQPSHGLSTFPSMPAVGPGAVPSDPFANRSTSVPAMPAVSPFGAPPRATQPSMPALNSPFGGGGFPPAQPPGALPASRTMTERALAVPQGLPPTASWAPEPAAPAWGPAPPTGAALQPAPAWGPAPPTGTGLQPAALAWGPAPPTGAALQPAPPLWGPGPGTGANLSSAPLAWGPGTGSAPAAPPAWGPGTGGGAAAPQAWGPATPGGPGAPSAWGPGSGSLPAFANPFAAQQGAPPAAPAAPPWAAPAAPSPPLGFAPPAAFSAPPPPPPPPFHAADSEMLEEFPVSGFDASLQQSAGGGLSGPGNPDMAQPSLEFFEEAPAPSGEAQGGARPLFDADAASGNSDVSEPTRVSDLPPELQAAMRSSRPLPSSTRLEAVAPRQSPRSPTVVQRRSHEVRKVALGVVGLLLVAGGMGASLVVPYGSGPSTVAEAAAHAFSEWAGLTPAADLEPEGVRATTWALPEGHRLLLLLGSVENHGTTTVPAVLVRAEFRDLKGAPLKTEEAYAGTVPSEVDLAELVHSGRFKAERKDLIKRLAGQGLAPGASWNFVIMVEDPPETMARGEVQLTAHRADPPTVATAVQPIHLEEAAPPEPPPAVTAQPAPPVPPPPPAPEKKRGRNRRPGAAP